MFSKENLSLESIKQQDFTATGQKLISQEECLFSLKKDGVGSSKSLVEEGEDEVENLHKKFEDLLRKILSSVRNSLNVQTNEEKELLKSAVLAIQQNEEQDKRWMGIKENKKPPWRPMGFRQSHDHLLENLVAMQMENAKLDSDGNFTSSIQKEIAAKAKQLKKDLLQVAKHVNSCYPEENIVQQYAELYHNAFRTRLSEITNSGLCIQDCTNVLQWVNNGYPQ